VVDVAVEGRAQVYAYAYLLGGLDVLQRIGHGGGGKAGQAQRQQRGAHQGVDLHGVVSVDVCFMKSWGVQRPWARNSCSSGVDGLRSISPGPVSQTRPWCMKITTSATRAANSISWVTSTM